MKKLTVIFLCLCSLSALAQNRTFPIDTAIVTQHSATINGSKLTYSATTGMQPVWNGKGEPIATLHYTYYTRTDIKKNDKENTGRRPLLISFNGGPGSASVWMHVAYTGPKVLNIDEEGYPVQPYGVQDNPYSVLDVADILYVNPVNTGFSRTIPTEGKEVDRDYFFGVNADIRYLADWLDTFVSRYDRWRSPKFIIGESYGGTRVAGLALALQERQWMYLNGVIMVSPADYTAMNSDPAVASTLNFPYFTAAAWHHNMLPEALQQQDLLDILPEAEEYAIQTLMPALARGSSLPEEEKRTIASQMAYYTGVSEEVFLQHNLDVPTQYFWKELLRDRSGYTIGRLDSRYLGIDKVEAGDSPDYSAELTSWLHSFTPAINHYLREDLNFETDLKYNMFGPVHPWDFTNNNTRENLREAMAINPYLNVFFQSGYYDGATTYFSAKYTMWQLDPSGKMSDRLRFEGYKSGHMMYLRREDLQAATNDLRNFIQNSISYGKAAKYEE